MNNNITKREILGSFCVHFYNVHIKNHKKYLFFFFGQLFKQETKKNKKIRSEIQDKFKYAQIELCGSIYGYEIKKTIDAILNILQFILWFSNITLG